VQREKVFNARDVAGQAAGHFVGKIAGGEPPFFSTQFNMCVFEESEIPQFSKLIDIPGYPAIEEDTTEEILLIILPCITTIDDRFRLLNQALDDLKLPFISRITDQFYAKTHRDHRKRA
jgi:hypothetical protein